jgi:ribonucleoside-diphosphate reductase alpha chain
MSMKTLKQLQEIGEAPMTLKEDGYITLTKGYLLPGETPKMMYRRVAKSAASYLFDASLEERFFKILWANWLCPATPILTNGGTTRGLNISCNSLHVPDSLDGIFSKLHELAMLSKNGAGVGLYVGDIRGRGTPITGNGASEGVIPFLKCFDSTTQCVSQGSVRRGAAAAYLPVNHPDIEEFIDMRKPTGDANSRCMNLHHGVCVDDEFMRKVESGDEKARETWKSMIRSRFQTGEPYLFFSDNVNKKRPECYVKNNLYVKTSNICSEIMLHTDPDHTFVCCLSSLNLARYDEWKDTDTVELTTMFLDAVLSEYIEKAKGKPGMEASVRSAEKGRAIGIGVLGWHTLLQEKGIAFDSFEAMRLNSEIFKLINDRSLKASQDLAKQFGEPEWCQGFGIRNTHRVAVAPTATNSIISGSVSAGIEPIAANAFALKTAKGTFFRKNATLERLLETKGKNDSETWKFIVENEGSVQALDCLSDKEKEIFLTAREISQFAIIRQAAQRQQFIDQGQSVNLFFARNSDPKYIHEVHMEAWRSGLKTLYYCRAESLLKGDAIKREKDECKACES